MGSYGRIVNSTISRLAVFAKPGDTSITVDNCDGWLYGDEIIISTTDLNTSMNDRAVIIGLNGCQLSLSKALNFSHYGAVNPDNKTNLGTLDMRSEVAVLTRNIIIRGSDEDGWGCRVQVTDFLNEPYLHHGVLNFDGVEMYNCGQQDTEKAAISFEMMDLGLGSSVNNTVIHDSVGWHMKLEGVQNISVTNNVMWGSIKLGMRISNSNRFTIRKNLIGYVAKREWVDASQMMIDVVAGIYFRIAPAGQMIYEVSGNIVAGSPLYGYAWPGHNCDESPYGFFNNTAHGTYLGWFGIINSTACAEFRYFTGYRNLDAFITHFDTNDVRVRYSIFADNNNSITANTGKEGDTLSTIISDNYIMGSPLYTTCPLCRTARPDICQNKHGIRSTLHLSASQPLPLESIKALPLWAKDHEASFGGVTSIINNIFSDWHGGDICSGSSILQINDRTSDESSVHVFSHSTKINVNDSVLFAFMNPPLSWVNIDDCGNWPCTGPLNIEVKDTTGEFLNNIGTALPNNPGIVDSNICTAVPAWNGYNCTATDYGMMVFESLDADKTGRIVSPVNLTIHNQQSFFNSLNTYMDHTWAGFYTGLVRLSRFPSLVQLNETYNITWTGTIPGALRFKLQGSTSDDYTIVRMQYTTPQSVQVTAGKTVIDPVKIVTGKEYDIIANASSCGVNKYYIGDRIIEFVLNGKPDCYIQLALIDSVAVSIRLDTTIDDFFATKQDTTFVDKLAALLGITTDRIKIVSIRKGSVIVDFIVNADSKNSDKASSQAELNSNVNKIIAGVQSGNVSFGSPILGMTYTTQFSNITDGNGTNSTNSTTTDPIVIIVNSTKTNKPDHVYDGKLLGEDWAWELSPAWITGIVVMSVAALALLIAVCWYFYNRKRMAAKIIHQQIEQSAPQLDLQVDILPSTSPKAKLDDGVEGLIQPNTPLRAQLVTINRKEEKQKTSAPDEDNGPDTAKPFKEGRPGSRDNTKDNFFLPEPLEHRDSIMKEGGLSSQEADQVVDLPPPVFGQSGKRGGKLPPIAHNQHRSANMIPNFDDDDRKPLSNKGGPSITDWGQ